MLSALQRCMMSTEPRRIKILTYNIHKGFSAGNRRFVLHQMKSQLRSVDADVVFLQEIQGEHFLKSKKHHNWPDESQFEFLADEVWPHHAYGKNAIYEAGHHGNAILSKYPFARWDNIDVSYMRTASRSLLHGVIKLGDTLPAVHVVCVHLGLLSMERRRQVAKLVERINEFVPNNEPMIIAGDFNDWGGQSDAALQRELGVTEVFNEISGRCARTFPAWMPLLSVDRVYSRGVSIVGGQRMQGALWKKMSDHLPLLAEFQLDI